MLSKKLTILVVCFLFLISSNGFCYKKVKVFVLQAPGLIMPGVQQIAILDFEGRYGSDLTDKMITLLLEEQRGITAIRGGLFSEGKEGRTLQKGAFTNIFDIVERSRLNQVLREQQLGLSGLVDENSAVDIGRMIGVQAVALGSIDYNYKDTPGTVERRDKSGTYYVKALHRLVRVTAKIRVVEVETGRILGSDERVTEYEDTKYGQEDIKKIFDVRSAVESGTNALAWAFANYLAPYFALGEYELEKIKVKKYKKIADQAAKKAEHLEINEAYAIYKTIYDEDPYNPKLLYNMGILHEVVGNFEKAAEFYGMAMQLKGEKKYKKANARIEKNVALIETLAALGVEIEEHSFTISEANKEAVFAKKIQIKGGDGDRINIYSQPEEGSKIVSKVPGGITFTVVQQEGQWYQIKLLGGKEGYVHFNKVKVKN